MSPALGPGTSPTNTDAKTKATENRDLVHLLRQMNGAKLPGTIRQPLADALRGIQLLSGALAVDIETQLSDKDKANAKHKLGSGGE